MRNTRADGIQFPSSVNGVVLHNSPSFVGQIVVMDKAMSCWQNGGRNLLLRVVVLAQEVASLDGDFRPCSLVGAVHLK